MLVIMVDLSLGETRVSPWKISASGCFAIWPCPKPGGGITFPRGFHLVAVRRRGTFPSMKPSMKLPCYMRPVNVESAYGSLQDCFAHIFPPTVT